MRVLEPSSSPFSAYSSGRVRPPPNRSLRGYIEREFDVSRELLRKPREGQNVFGNACTAGASVPKNTLTVTARYQRHSSGIRESILSSNSRYINMSVTWSDSSLADCIVQTTATDRAERFNPLENCTIRASYVHFGGIMEQRLYALISLRP